MRLRLTLSVVALLLAAAVSILFHPIPLVEVTRGDGTRLFAVRADRPLRVRLEYMHSVERTPVLEVYEVSPNGLRLVRTEFVSQGAGLPSEGFVKEGGRFVLRTDRPLSRLSIRVSQVAVQHLLVGGKALDLLWEAGDGAEVVLAVRRRPWLLVLRSGVLRPRPP